MREAASFIAVRSSGSGDSLLATGLKCLRLAQRAWTGRRRLLRLADLDDHILQDIGVKREDVAWALSLPWDTDAVQQLQVRAARRQGRGWRECQ